MALRLEQVFGGSAESWLVQQLQRDLAQIKPNHLKLRRLRVA
jgi:plasmid maintenance system antidote protein VapI